MVAPSPALGPATGPGAEFYRGKTIRILVGYGVGGSYDLNARVAARFLPRYLPGNPNVIVENRPGGSSLLVANAVFNSEVQDGTVIGGINPNTVVQQLLGESAVQFDARRFQWLGAPATSPSACAARIDSGVSSIREIMDGGSKELTVGATGPGGNTHDVPVVLNAVLGTRFKVASGYASNANIAVGVERKEIQGNCRAFDAMSGTDRQQFEGPTAFMKVIVIMGDKVLNNPLLQGVPTAASLAKTEEDRQVLRLADGPSLMARPLMVGPSVPAERVAALRTALAAAYRDPEMQETVLKMGETLDPLAGEDIGRVVEQTLATPPAAVERMRQALAAAAR